jgi:hypothetical protein
MSTPPDAPDDRVTRENTYLRQRNAQLQEDLVSLGAETERLRQIVERLHGRAGSRTPDSLSEKP